MGSQALTTCEPNRHLAVFVHARQRAHHGDKQTQRENGGHLAKHGEAHDQHHVRRADIAFGGLPQGTDQHHGHDHGDEYHEGGTEAAPQLLAYR